ncbi:uncharacterized protein LOC129222823 [Uloborus diversus]|uniref:uncharacterized protein LOC129222823 n=1 Tax=Uloborus diversus TaxID=327109 RepID=UPI00240A6CE7|nr:uncharacterized protein LOC129222823 [Uloborus diversus]
MENEDNWIEPFECCGNRLSAHDQEKRMASKTFQKLRDYFRQFQIELKEKFSNFGKWVQTFAHKALEKGKSNIENIRAIAKEVLDKADHLQRQVTVEALEFFRPYREHLGKLWDELLRKLSSVQTEE